MKNEVLDFNVIVIGAGAGGMCAAARLSGLGYRTCSWIRGTRSADAHQRASSMDFYAIPPPWSSNSTRPSPRPTVTSAFRFI